MKIYNTATPYYDRNFTTGSNERLNNKPLFQNTVVKNSAGAQVKYFSSLDADLYFSDTFIDEVTGIQFQTTQNTLPLFGYNSYVFDDIAVGSRIISGQFAINFTSSNYLYNVLNTMSKIVRNNANYAASASENKSGTAAETSSTGDYFYDHQHNPLWSNAFDIYISYGGNESKSSSTTYYVLRGVQLTGCSQQIDSSGVPIQELYTFVAQDLLTEEVTSDSFVASDPSAATTTQAQQDLFTINYMTYDVVSNSTSNPVGYLNIDYNLSNAASLLNITIVFGSEVNCKESISLDSSTTTFKTPMHIVVSDTVRKALESYPNSTFTVEIQSKCFYNNTINSNAVIKKTVTIDQ